MAKVFVKGITGSWPIGPGRVMFDDQGVAEVPGNLISDVQSFFGFDNVFVVRSAGDTERQVSVSVVETSTGVSVQTDNELSAQTVPAGLTGNDISALLPHDSEPLTGKRRTRSGE